MQDRIYTITNQRSENSSGNHFVFSRLQGKKLDTELNHSPQGWQLTWLDSLPEHISYVCMYGLRPRLSQHNPEATIWQSISKYSMSDETDMVCFKLMIYTQQSLLLIHFPLHWTLEKRKWREKKSPFRSVKDNRAFQSKPVLVILHTSKCQLLTTD